MTPLRESMRGREALVVGMGRSGVAATRDLIARGARVTATDSRQLSQLGRAVALFESAGVRLVLGGHNDADFERAELIVVSPGVPLSIPPLLEARQRGVRIISEIDLAAEPIGPRTVAITGSNGKSTVTALAAKMLGAAGREEIPCGNFGTPLVEATHGDSGTSWYALELSSFQLELTDSLRCAAAVLLNIQPDHLDRHGTFDRYRDAKWKIAQLREKGAPIVLCLDDEHTAVLAGRAEPPVLPVSTCQKLQRGGWIEAGELRLRTANTIEVICSVEQVPIPGEHNLLNILAAATATRAVGVPVEAIRAAVTSYTALAHRMQEAATIDGVTYVDDSKATNVASCVQALRSYPGRHVIVLLGGRDKDGDFGPLAKVLLETGAAAITFGEAGDGIADHLQGCAFQALDRSRTMEAGLERAHELARPGDVVLLSPACASFDAFAGFAARGDAFAHKARSFAEVGS